MPKVLSLKEDIEAALVLLRKRGHHRAALRLEKMSLRILKPELFPKEKPMKPRRVQIVDGSGRTHPIKLTLKENDDD